ncbi:MAG TPA: hypothetical protein VJU84_19935 [Pyrinomonadaceae bacterium]|nr:hypothetical protein [Pyrinomonadaceae bacterium]
MRTLVVIGLLVGSFVGVVAQQPSQKAQAIAATFNKHKNVVKEKRGVRMEKYKDVRAEPVVKQDAGDYLGIYEVGDLGFLIRIEVSNVDKILARGYEQGGSRTFKLENATIEGGLLTGSKVYQDGTTESFEGVFLNRTERNSPTAMPVTTFGLGVWLNKPVEINGLTFQRMFYELKR